MSLDTLSRRQSISVYKMYTRLNAVTPTVSHEFQAFLNKKETLEARKAFKEDYLKQNP